MTAIEYIQQAANKINMAASIDGAILKLFAVIVAPWCKLFHHWTEK